MRQEEEEVQRLRTMYRKLCGIFFHRFIHVAMPRRITERVQRSIWVSFVIICEYYCCRRSIDGGDLNLQCSIQSLDVSSGRDCDAHARDRNRTVSLRTWIVFPFQRVATHHPNAARWINKKQPDSAFMFMLLYSKYDWFRLFFYEHNATIECSCKDGLEVQDHIVTAIVINI